MRRRPGRPGRAGQLWRTETKASIRSFLCGGEPEFVLTPKRCVTECHEEEGREVERGHMSGVATAG